MPSTLTTWTLPAETKEWIGPIVVEVDGVVVSSFEVTVTEDGSRPSAWIAATEIGGLFGVLVGTGTAFTLTPGHRYVVWARFTANPEIPVLRAGLLRAE